MSAAYEKIFDSVMELLQSPAAKELAPQERVSIMGMARSALAVPGTIWSPEDFLEFIPVNAEDREDLADRMWQDFDIDCTDAEWEQLRLHAEEFLNEEEAK